jgi:hypothetical protein
MQERTDGVEQFKFTKGLNTVVDTFRIMGKIVEVSFAHPSRASTIIYNSQTREIKEPQNLQKLSKSILNQPISVMKFIIDC